MFDWTVKRFRAPYCLGIEHKSRQSKIDLAWLFSSFDFITQSGNFCEASMCQNVQNFCPDIAGNVFACPVPAVVECTRGCIDDLFQHAFNLHHSTSSGKRRGCFRTELDLFITGCQMARNHKPCQFVLDCTYYSEPLGKFVRPFSSNSASVQSVHPRPNGIIRAVLSIAQKKKITKPSRFLTDDSCVQSLDSKAPGTVSRSNQTLLINLYMTGQ
ncbi:hypothetical protein T4D_2876 [Trichinella pseudospiralis]|uniref:Uncharacterized protein n=1 Tax=Trichinella pseudospiralis TaxID=6337 RepID=A0A0V1FR93_TRIPS|nr:hypothetical protein T4D_2876 [Trichinella pseudospiralis]